VTFGDVLLGNTTFFIFALSMCNSLYCR